MIIIKLNELQLHPTPPRPDSLPHRRSHPGSGPVPVPVNSRRRAEPAGMEVRGATGGGKQQKKRPEPVVCRMAQGILAVFYFCFYFGT